MKVQEEIVSINGQSYLISTDKNRLDIDFITDYLINHTYWASTRTLEQVNTSIEHSLCFGVYYENKQIAFGRVMSDFATFAYLADVFVVNDFRGRGISKELLKFILAHPHLQKLRRFMLATRDAHGLYEKFGFKELHFPERWMELYTPTTDDPNQ